jgi:hypothetical protein
VVSPGQVDLWACVASAVAAGALATRAHMLKPHQEVWAKAPWPVWVSMIGLAIGLAMASITIARGGHASAREATIYTLLAATACVLLWNLNRHGRANDLLSRLHKGGQLMTIEKWNPADSEAWARGVMRKQDAQRAAKRDSER